MTTYRKFDRFRAHSAFATDEDAFNTLTANKWISTGTGTPANAQATNGGLNLVTSAASGDSSVVQRGIETAATKLASIPLRKGKKVSIVARFEAASLADLEVNFGLGPAATNPFTGTGSVYLNLKNDGTYTFAAGANTGGGSLDLNAQRDAWNGVDLEIYWDGADSIGFYINGKRIGGFNKLTIVDATGFITGLPNALSLSAGIVSRTATAKTVNLRRIGSAVQIVPDQRANAA